jgi:hypothetical protein
MVGSNFRYRLEFSMLKPKTFASLVKSKIIPHQLGVVDDVRTNNTKHDMLMHIAHEVGQMLNDEDGKQNYGKRNRGWRGLRRWIDIPKELTDRVRPGAKTKAKLKKNLPLTRWESIAKRSQERSRDQSQQFRM